MLWTIEAPARREPTITNEDNAREGVPVGGRPPPNFLPESILALIFNLFCFQQAVTACRDMEQGKN
jgi:hypothetical protein